MITVILLTGIPFRSHPNLEVFRILPGDLLSELKLISPPAQMDRIGIRLHGSHPNLNLGIRPIITHHRHGHGVGVPLVQIARQLHILHIGILALACVIEHGQQFHLPGCERRRGVCKFASGLPPVGEYDQTPGALRRDHGKRPGNGILKIRGRLVRQRHNPGKVIFSRQKLLHQGIFTEGDDTVLVPPGHILQRILYILFHGPQILLIAVGNIHKKNGGVHPAAPAYGHTRQRQQHHSRTHQAHCQIKLTAAARLPHI